MGRISGSLAVLTGVFLMLPGFIALMHGASDATQMPAWLVRDLAMQVAAADPQFVRREDVTAAAIEKEKDIARARALGEGKPEKMLDKIAEGRMSKFYEEVCLLEQPFIRENSITVSDLIKAAGSKIGDTITVARFVRYKVGDSGDAPGVEQSPLPVTA